MTNSAPTKRDMLVDGARKVLHEQGVQKTTIADVATAAEVPLGNVYYYFKTKDEIVKAAIDAHARDIEEKLKGFESHRTPKARLRAFVREWIDQADMAAEYGCPHGSLCAELDKRDDALNKEAAKLMKIFVDWTERQFKEMGAATKRDAHENALELIASFQGSALLANTYRDPEIVIRQSRRSERWINSLA